MLTNFKTGWTKSNIGSYDMPIWKLELIDKVNSKFKFKLAVVDKKEDRVDCLLSGFLKDDYSFSIPANQAYTDKRLDAGKIFKWVMEQIGRFLCPQCN